MILFLMGNLKFTVAYKRMSKRTQRYFKIGSGEGCSKKPTPGAGLK
jgi:hypothetical protein